MDNLINFFFPPKCVFCNLQKGQVICAKCIQECKEIFTTHCIVCDNPSLLGTTHLKCTTTYTPITQTSIFEYANFVRLCIKNAKYTKRQFMALKYLTNHGITLAIQHGYKVPPDFIIVPIPLNPQKLNKRGFNQALKVAAIFSKALKVKVDTKLLARTKATTVQFKHNRNDRFKNVENAFCVHPQYQNYIKDKKILLVDDICTSGATLLEASKTLYMVGAAQVYCLTLAKTPVAKTPKV